MPPLSSHQQRASNWFRELRDQLCSTFEKIEHDCHFTRTPWERPGGGGGEMSIMRGKVFEKIGVNVSTVYGLLENKTFFATGISVVAHPTNPHVPVVHMNTRFIEMTTAWFGGGADLTPTFPDETETSLFHEGLKNICDQHDEGYYPRFTSWCDDYFYLPHRKEPRGVGGIFYDNLSSGDWEKDFAFTQDVGKTFGAIYPKLVRTKMDRSWTKEEKEQQLLKRGRYVEFNLLYDRGTKFGLLTGGNTDAILMSLPPEVKWL